MTSITLNIVIGVVAGLVTSAILLILRNLFLNSFLPWYRQVIFKGIDLSGNWYSVQPQQKILLELSQSSEALVGKATVHLHTKKDLGQLPNCHHLDDIRTFEVTGEISERFVSLKLTHTDQKRLGIVTLLMLVEGDGTIMSGQGCWYAPLVTAISSGPRKFYRDESRAAKNLQLEEKRKQVAKSKSIKNSSHNIRK